MSTKAKALWAAVIAGVAGVLSYVAVIPPQLQDGFIASLVALLPEKCRGEIGLFFRFLMSAGAVYATIHAARSGPQTPPQNPPQ